jgi:hypothetical protein
MEFGGLITRPNNFPLCGPCPKPDASSSHPHKTNPLISTLIVYFHLFLHFQYALFPSGWHITISPAFIIFPTRPNYLLLLDFIAKIFCEENMSWKKETSETRNEQVALYQRHHVCCGGLRRSRRQTARLTATGHPGPQTVVFLQDQLPFVQRHTPVQGVRAGGADALHHTVSWVTLKYSKNVINGILLRVLSAGSSSAYKKIRLCPFGWLLWHTYCKPRKFRYRKSQKKYRKSQDIHSRFDFFDVRFI